MIKVKIDLGCQCMTSHGLELELNPPGLRMRTILLLCVLKKSGEMEGCVVGSPICEWTHYKALEVCKREGERERKELMGRNGGKYKAKYDRKAET